MKDHTKALSPAFLLANSGSLQASTIARGLQDALAHRCQES